MFGSNTSSIPATGTVGESSPRLMSAVSWGLLITCSVLWIVAEFLFAFVLISKNELDKAQLLLLPFVIGVIIAMFLTIRAIKFVAKSKHTYLTKVSFNILFSVTLYVWLFFLWIATVTIESSFISLGSYYGLHGIFLSWFLGFACIISLIHSIIQPLGTKSSDGYDYSLKSPVLLFAIVLVGSFVFAMYFFP